jgi:serine/threonine protein kinase
MTECLTIEQIERYATGAAEADEAAATAAHLEVCPSCRKRLESHRAGEAFLADVRGSYDAADARASSLGRSGTDFLAGYRISEEIHRGGQGIVYKAVQLSTDRIVALKVILGGPLATQEARKRFEREVKLAAALHHPHIVVVHDSGVADGSPYVVMDYVDGARITEYATLHDLSIGERLRLFASVCDAVEYAHQRGVIHRDLKPSNILVNEDGEPVIVDFGLARPIQETQDGPSVTAVSAPGQVVGSLPYLSPEQAAGDPSQIDERTDIYALGVMLYELLTGTRPPPVVSDSNDRTPRSSSAKPLPPSQACVGLDPRLNSVVLKAIERDKARRYRSAGDFATVIRTYLEQPDSGAKPTRRRLLWHVVLAILVIYSCALTVLWNEASKRPPIPEDTYPYPPFQIHENWTKNYHNHTLTPFAWDDFDGYWFGQNPPLIPFETDDTYNRPNGLPRWEHFEGENMARSEGLSNLYVTGYWHKSGLRSLRAKTGTGDSVRVSTTNIWDHVKDAERFYYRCWIHVWDPTGSGLYFGFVSEDPGAKTTTFWSPRWTNSVQLHRYGTVVWYWHDDGWNDAPLQVHWTPGKEYACFLHVALDFDRQKGFVWINGEQVGDELSISPRRFQPKSFRGQTFRLDRWGFTSPGNYEGYHPSYTDIDDLEFGTWEYASPGSQQGTDPLLP